LRDVINQSPFLLEREGAKEIAFLQPARRLVEAFKPISFLLKGSFWIYG